MKKQSSAESTIRTHQLESVPCVVIRLEIVPLISTPNRVPNGVPTPPLSSVPPITAAEIASISRPLPVLRIRTAVHTEKESAESCKKAVQKVCSHFCSLNIQSHHKCTLFISTDRIYRTSEFCILHNDYDYDQNDDCNDNCRINICRGIFLLL